MNGKAKTRNMNTIDCQGKAAKGLGLANIFRIFVTRNRGDIFRGFRSRVAKPIENVDGISEARSLTIADDFSDFP